MKVRPVSFFSIGAPTEGGIVNKPAVKPKLVNAAGIDLDAGPQTRHWQLTPPDQQRLVQLAEEAPNQDACKAAFEKITNQILLAELALEGSTDFIRLAAIPRVTNEEVLEKFAMAPKLVYSNPDVEQRVSDLEKLVAGCLVAVGNISDQTRLARLATESENSEVRRAAMKKLTDPELLARIALLDKDFVVRFATIERLTNRPTLQRMAADDKNAMVRAAAAKKLVQLDAAAA